jgi:hypothetical protein
MAHIEIKPAAIEEESPIAGRLFVVAIMQVDRAGLCLPEKVILHSHRPGVRMGPPFIAANQTAVFGFDAGDAIHPPQPLPQA